VARRYIYEGPPASLDSHSPLTFTWMGKDENCHSFDISISRHDEMGCVDIGFILSGAGGTSAPG